MLDIFHIPLWLPYWMCPLTFMQVKNDNPPRDTGWTLPHSCFFPLHLQLMDLQLSDSNFRRHILLQYLILFQYLKGQVKFKRWSMSLLWPFGKQCREAAARCLRFIFRIPLSSYSSSCVLNDDQTTWIEETTKLVYQVSLQSRWLLTHYLTCSAVEIYLDHCRVMSVHRKCQHTEISHADLYDLHFLDPD